MHIFALLGLILDKICEDEIINGEVVVKDRETINKYIVPIINEDVYIDDSSKVTLKFGKNPCCHRGELQSILIENKGKPLTTVKVGDAILDILTDFRMDEIYFSICDEIIF